MVSLDQGAPMEGLDKGQNSTGCLDMVAPCEDANEDQFEGHSCRAHVQIDPHWHPMRINLRDIHVGPMFNRLLGYGYTRGWRWHATHNWILSI